MSNGYKYEMGKRYLIKNVLAGRLSDHGYSLGYIIDTSGNCHGCKFMIDPDGDLRLDKRRDVWSYGYPFLYTSSLEEGDIVLLEDDISNKTVLPYLHDQSYSAMDMTFNKGCAFWHVINSHKNVDNKEQSLRDMKSAIWHLEQEILRLEKPIEQV